MAFAVARKGFDVLLHNFIENCNKEKWNKHTKKGEDIKNGIKKCNQGNKTDSFFFIHLKFKNAYDV